MENQSICRLNLLMARKLQLNLLQKADSDRRQLSQNSLPVPKPNPKNIQLKDEKEEYSLIAVEISRSKCKRRNLEEVAEKDFRKTKLLKKRKFLPLILIHRNIQYYNYELY